MQIEYHDESPRQPPVFQSEFAFLQILEPGMTVHLDPEEVLLVWMEKGVVSLKLKSSARELRNGHEGIVYLLGNDCLYLTQAVRVRLSHQFLETKVYFFVLHQGRFVQVGRELFRDDAMLDPFAEQAFPKKSLLLHYPQTQQIVRWLKSLTAGPAPVDTGWEAAAIWFDIARVLMAFSAGPSSDIDPFEGLDQGDKILWILHYIRSEYATATLQEAAGVLHYSPDYLSRLIVAHTGRSFSELLHVRRTLVAKKELATEEKPLHLIALELGYQSYSGFYRSFLREAGMTPSEYRARVRRGELDPGY